MLHQLIFKSLNGLFGITRDKSNALLVLLASILLTACGGSEVKKEVLPEPGPDSINPTIFNPLAVNKCNYTKSVGLDNTILFEIEGSESLMKPVVTILGERANVVGNWTGAVDVNGSAKKWKAEFPVLGPETVDANLKLFISEFSNFLYEDIQKGIEKISYSVSFQDLAEEIGNDLPEGDAASLLASAITAEYGVVITDEQQVDSSFNYDRLFELVLAEEIFFSKFVPGVKTVNTELKEFIASYSDSVNVDDISESTSFAEFGDCYLADALENEYVSLKIPDDKVQDVKFDYSNVYLRVLQTKLEVREFNDYQTVAELQEEVKGFVASFTDTPASDIQLFTTFSELGGADLAAALVAEYNIEISPDDQLDPAFNYGSLFERVLAAELPSVNKLKQVLAPFNEGVVEDNGGNVLDIPLAFLSLGTPSNDNKQTDEVIKAITTAFDIKTTQENIVEIVSADVPQYAWLDKIQSLEIPVTISYVDTSGMVGEDVTLTSTDALRYCDDGVCQCFPEDISGQWRLRPKAGSMGVGRAEGNIGDWSATDFVWGTQRACLWDDDYIFVADSTNPQAGEFYQDMGDSTWMEAWQPPNIGVEECGTPYSPFDGSVPDMRYAWDVEAGTLTLKGLNKYGDTTGAYIGLPRVVNDIENKGTPSFEDVVYTIETASDELITLNIKSGGPSPWWHFELQKNR